MTAPVTADDIDAAAQRLGDRIRCTPVVEPGPGWPATPGSVTLKLELLQHTGSFKPRGAFNRVLANPVPDVGIIAASGGNHAQAVAHVAATLAVRAEIFVPATVPAAKLARLESYADQASRADTGGVEIVRVGELYDDAQAASNDRAAETGALVVHPYDQPEIVAGQGTLALELDAQVPDLDTVLVAVGGGGLMAGVATWFEGRARIVTVEPDRSRCLVAALEAGEPTDVSVSGLARDSLGVRRVGSIPFAVARRAVDEALCVTDDAISQAQRQLWTQMRVMAEPGAVVSLAAVLDGVYRPGPTERVAVIICGGNVDPATVAEEMD